MRNDVLKFIQKNAHVDIIAGGMDEGGFAARFPRSGMAVVVSWGERWDHVSVSFKDRLPTWAEMNWVKDLFWTNDECVVQYHPPKSDYVNLHPNCLHLWKPQGVELPRPPAYMVGPKPGQSVEHAVAEWKKTLGVA